MTDLVLLSQAYLLGRNEHHQLSHPLPSYLTSSHAAHDGSASATPAAPFPFPLDTLPDSNAPAELKEQGIISAACGRGHTILVTDQGQAWTAGWNTVGQVRHALLVHLKICWLNQRRDVKCGQSNDKKKDTAEHVSSFMRVKGELLDEKVVAASAGNNFSLFLCESGKVFSVGTGERGVIGIGQASEMTFPGVSEGADQLLRRPANG